MPEEYTLAHFALTVDIQTYRGNGHEKEENDECNGRKGEGESTHWAPRGGEKWN